MQRSLVTATKSRKKQQTEQVEAALKAEEDRKCTERENFLITAVPVTMQASYEPALHHAVGDDHDDGKPIKNNKEPLLRKRNEISLFDAWEKPATWALDISMFAFGWACVWCLIATVK